MATLGTFDSFTTARLGIYAAQHGLRVTGNNISNINTAGYTRQRVDQVSFKTGGNDRYASFMDRHIGSGALVRSINQIRDPYLDIRYRNTSSSTAYYDTKLSGLQEIAAILDEVGKGGKDGDDATKGDGLLYAQLQELADQLRAYGASPTSDNNTLIRSAAETLTALFQNYAGRLEQVRKDTEKDLVKNVEGANEILKNIRDLNKSIRDAELHGDKALELRDERNRQIDALSEYMHIKVEYTMEDVGAGIQVEKLTISLANDNPDPKVETDSSVLVDGLYATQLSIPKDKPSLNPYIIPSADDLANNPDLEKLKGFLFLQEVDPANLPDGYDAADVVTIDWPDADGNPQQITVVGTNDPAAEGILAQENDNYTIQLGKLLDVKGEEWINTKSTWTEVQGGTAGVNAVYSYAVTTGGNWNDGELLEIAGKTFTVGQGEFTQDVANDADKLAAFIAKNLSNSDYVISSNGPKIVFTAKKPGAIGGKGPADAPDLTLNNPGKVTLGTQVNDTPGVDSQPPANPQPPEGTVTDPVTGTEVTTAYVEVEGKWFQVTMEKEHTREVVLDDNDLYGALQAQRETLTEEGEFSSAADQAIDENALTKRGIPYYQKSLDLLAHTFATEMNKMNQGYLVNPKGEFIDPTGTDGAVLTVTNPNDPTQTYTLNKNDKWEDIPAWVTAPADPTAGTAAGPLAGYNSVEEYLAEPRTDANGDPLKDDNGNVIRNGAFRGGNLFSNNGNGNDDDPPITATNISISLDWAENALQIVPSFICPPDSSEPASSDSDNIINNFTSLSYRDLEFRPDAVQYEGVDNVRHDSMFVGTLEQMWINIDTVLGEDRNIASKQLDNFYASQVSIDTSRASVSSVDFNDEAMNLMMYAKSYNAACRLMTTIDSVLDKLINNTGLTT